MPGKTFEVNFRINGEVSSSLLAAIRASQNSMKGLASTSAQASKMLNPELLRTHQALQRISQMSAQIQPLQSVIAKTALATNAASAQTRQAASEYDNQRRKTRALEAELAALRTNTLRQRESYRTQRAEVRQYQERLSSLQKTLRQGRTSLSQSETLQLQAQISATSGKLDALKSKLAETRREQERLRTATQQTSEALSQQRKSESESARGLTSSQRNLTNLQSQLQSQRSALASLQHSLSQAGFSSANFAQQQARLQAELNRTTQLIERQTQISAHRQQFSQAGQDLSNSYSNFQNAIGTAQSIANPFREAIEGAMTFEHSMSRVKALTQMKNIRAGDTEAVQREMSMLESQAKQLGASTQFTMTQAADAMGYLGMAGWEAQQIYQTMPGMLNLAAGAGTDLARTADIVSDNMTAIGVPTSDASHFMDVYAYALTRSNLNLEALGESMKYAGPVAKAYGATLDETAAMMMMMANAGIKGSMAGTSLRMGLLRLAGPPKTATKAMADLGLSLSDAQAGALEAQAVLDGLGIELDNSLNPAQKMTQVLMQLHDKTKDLSQDEKLAAFKGIFGVNAETGWLALFDQGPEKFAEFVQGLKNADGYSQLFAKTMNDDTRGAMIAMESALDAAKISIGDALLPAVRGAAESITPLVTAFSAWAQENPQVVQGVAAIAAGLAAVTVAAAGVQLAFAGFNFVSAGISLAADAVSAFNARMIAMTSISSITATVQSAVSTMTTAISAAFTSARVAMASFMATAQSQGILTALGGAFRGLGSAIMGAFSPALAILAALALAGYYVYQNWDKVAPVFENIGNTIQSLFSGVGDNLTPSLNNLMEALQRLAPVAENLGGVIFGAMAVIGNAIVNTIVAAVNIVASVLKTIIDLASGIGNTIASVLAGDWTAAWESMKATAATFIRNIVDSIITAFKGIGEVFTNLWKPLEWMGVMEASKYSSKSSTVEQIPNSTSSTVEQIRQPSENAVLAASLSSLAESISTSKESDQSRIAEQLSQISQTLAQNESQRESSEQLMQIAESLKSDNVDRDRIAQSISEIAQSIQSKAEAGQTSESNVNVQQLNEAVSTASESVNQSAQSLSVVNEAVSTAGETITQSAQSMSAVNEAAMQTGTAFQNVNSEVMNQTSNLQQNSSELSNHMTALQSSEQQLSTFNEALSLPIGSLQVLSESSSSAASSVSNLATAASSVATALSSAATAIANIKISAPTVTASANASGGIYKQGAFLTWFAEDSAEAAIPLDRSARAIMLWQQAGQMLGVYPQEDHLGNIVNLQGSSENVITEGDDLSVVRAKRAAQYQQYLKNQEAVRNVLQTSQYGTTNSDVRVQSQAAQVAATTQMAPETTLRQDFVWARLDSVDSFSDNQKRNAQTSSSVKNSYSDDNSRQMNFTITVNYNGSNFDDFERQFRELMHDLQRRSYG